MDLDITASLVDIECRLVTTLSIQLVHVFPPQ